MSSKLRIGILLAATFGLGLVGAAAITGAFDEAAVCADSLGGIGMSIGDAYSAETAEGAIENFVTFGINAPELLEDDQAIALDDESLIVTIFEDGIMVAWFQVEPTADGGFTVGLEAYCTDGDNGPFLAKSFDPRGRLGMETEISEGS